MTTMNPYRNSSALHACRCGVWLLLIFILSAVSIPLQAQPSSELDRVVSQVQKDKALAHASLSVCVYNVSTGKRLYANNAERSMVPASVQKLFTTGVGFARLGNDFRFVTKLYLRGDLDREGVLHGNVYIFGGGDPMLGSYRYRQTSMDSLFSGWTKALRKKGVRRVDGRVCYCTSVFDDQPLHDTWQWGDVGNYYGAGVCGLNFHENMFFVHFNPGKRVGHPATMVRTVPKNIDIHGTCEVNTGTENSGDQVVIYGSPTSKERLYRGTVPIGQYDFGVRGAMPNPARTCADLFASHLRSQGIAISMGSMQVLHAPDSLRTLLDYYSPQYYTIAQYTNLMSNNIYAESIFKYLGYAKYGTGSFENGAKAVYDYFAERGLETGGVRVVDGSGLSRQNLTTADFVCRYLMVLGREPFYDNFRRSLAEVGQSGTAKNMLPNLPKGITVLVKSGSMEGVRCYAGYVTTRGGETLAYAIMANDFTSPAKEVSELLNRILLKLATVY